MKKRLAFGFICTAVVFAFFLRPQSIPKDLDTTPSPNPPDIAQTVREPHSVINTREGKTLRHQTKTSSADKDPKQQNPAAMMLDRIAHISVRQPASIQPVFSYGNKTYPLRTYKPLTLPNDPSASQWWISNTGLSTAWDTAHGARQTTLAVIDTGFGLAHEEFSGRWLANAGENGTTNTQAASRLNCTDRGLSLSASCNLIDDNHDTIVDNESGSTTRQNPSRRNCTAQGVAIAKHCNLIDDDGNGFVDDTNGWDFINYDNSSQAGEVSPNGASTNHGTRVMGIAAATGNNAKGIAGVDWHTKLLPIQAINDDGYGDTLSVGRSILYAASRGADVINLSLGSTVPDDFVREAVAAATASGSVVVAAAGNDGCECIMYPANYPEVLAVGALNSSDSPASFSNWGASLDIMAPGYGMTSASWTSANPTSAYASGIAGTSYAAPLVSGVLTRVLSRQSAITPLQLIALVTESNRRTSLSADTARNNTLGFGRLDAAAATARSITPLSSGQDYAYTPISLGDVIGTYEPAGAYAPYACRNSRPGTTPLYELTKASTRIFTISNIETYNAEADGYSSNLVTYVCLQQPQDTFSQLRLIDTFKEFRNLFVK